MSTPVPEGVRPPWVPVQALKRGRKQEWHLSNDYYVLLSWEGKKGFKIAWSPSPTGRQDWQQPLSRVEYRKHVNDARRLFSEQVRCQQIDFATKVLTS